MKLLYGDRAAREVSERICAPTATTTTLKAIPADRRVDGMVAIVLFDSSLWVFDKDSSAGASSTVLVPDAGSGRWLALGISAFTGVKVASKAIGHADLTDADGAQTIDFDAALPTGAVVIGAGANVTEVFDNAGDTASCTFDLGIASGNTDGFVDGGSLNAIAKVGTPCGTDLGALVGEITPSVIVMADVNLDTLTKGAAVFYVLYTLAF